jgi:hypothetical protein
MSTPWIVTSVVAFPFLFYFTVKLGSYAFHRGKYLAEQRNRKDQGKDG